MANGEIKSACNVLEERGGTREGTPSGLLRNLGFNGSWGEFRSSFPGSIDQIDTNRYHITLVGVVTESDTHESAGLDLETWAAHAADYVLDPERPGLTEYGGDYSVHHQALGALATTVDEAIAGMYCPPETEADVPIYELHDTGRGLYYAASSRQFRVFGAEILDASQLA